MKNKAYLVSIVLGLICGALSYWFNPYNDLYLLGIHIYYIMGISSFVSVIGLGLKYKNHLFVIPIFYAIGFIIAAILRVIYDTTIIDPTHHNLFPFEIAIILMIIVPTSILGILLIYAINKLNFK